MIVPRKLADDCFAFADKERMRHADVLATIADRLTCIAADETIPLNAGSGRVLAQNVYAPRNIPSYDNAAVDGYAFAHKSYLKDKPLIVSAQIAAGDAAPPAVPPGHCARILTGAAMPPGTDTVAMQEDCKIGKQAITIPQGLKAGVNRRRAGEDVKIDDRVAAQNTVLQAADLAAIASTGLGQIMVRQKLRIGILSSGNEILAPGTPYRDHAVYDANRPMLRALTDRPYAHVIDLGHCPDDAARLAETIDAAANQCDLIVTSGGASRGDEDHLLDVLQKLGTAHVWQIAIKPGRPMIFGQIRDTVLMALPGNPVAAMVCFVLYGRRICAALTGASTPPPIGYRLPAAFDIPKKKPDRREFLRGWRFVDPQTAAICVHKFDRDGSGLITGLQAAEGLIEIDETTTHIKKGDPVRFIPFSDLEI